MDYEGELTVSEGDSGCCSSDGQFRRRSTTVTGLGGSTGFVTSPPATVGIGGLRPPRRKRRPSYNKAVGSLGGSPAVGNFETTSAESLQILSCRQQDHYDEREPIGGSGPLSAQTRATTASSFYDRVAENDPATVHASLPTLSNRNV